jgi:hypothetical protein
MVGNQLSIGGGAGVTAIGEPTAAVRSLRPSNVSMNGSLTFATLGGLRINIGAELSVQRALQWTWDEARQVSSTLALVAGRQLYLLTCCCCCCCGWCPAADRLLLPTQTTDCCYQQLLPNRDNTAYHAVIMCRRSCASPAFQRAVPVAPMTHTLGCCFPLACPSWCKCQAFG